MQYTEKTESYNEKRYGKPWLAIVTTSLTKDFRFIDWTGRWGYAGEFVFNATPGSMLAYGQKDMRKNRGGVDGYQICMPDGTIPAIPDSWAAELRKLTPESRWVRAAERFLTRAVSDYRGAAKDEPNTAKYFARAERWSKILGVQSPIMADIADALGLIDHPAPTAPAAIEVSMEAFGL